MRRLTLLVLFLVSFGAAVFYILAEPQPTSVAPQLINIEIAPSDTGQALPLSCLEHRVLSPQRGEAYNVLFSGEVSNRCDLPLYRLLVHFDFFDPRGEVNYTGSQQLPSPLEPGATATYSIYSRGKPSGWQGRIQGSLQPDY